MPAARVRAFAKINLSLEVLNRRPDGFHNIRTIFQTISLSDMLTIEAEPAARTSVKIRANVEIPGENLVQRAAEAVLRSLRVRAAVSFDLRKRIPLGGGLGGGSSDAAAVLLSLPALLGRSLDIERLMELGSQLGSDVPFFLLGGTALGLGRGTELYALPDLPPVPGLVIAPGVHVSTARAYAALGRSAEWSQPDKTARVARATLLGRNASEWGCSNDFEAAVLPEYKAIAEAKRALRRAGAKVALLAGSGSSIFGLFSDNRSRDEAVDRLDRALAYRVSLVSRSQYRRAFLRSLSLPPNPVWPPARVC